MPAVDFEKRGQGTESSELARAAPFPLVHGKKALTPATHYKRIALCEVPGSEGGYFREARKRYERARELGVPEAEERLARLGAG